MKQFYTLLFFCLGMMFVGCSDDDKNEPQLPGEPGTEVPDGGEFNPENVGLEYDDGTNCAFNVKIAIDKEGWEMRDAEFFKNRLKTEWDAINERFNKLDKQGALKRNYVFIPDLEDIIIYENGKDDKGNNISKHWDVPVDHADKIDFNKFQCLVVYDFVIQDFEVGKGGGCGDDGKGMSNILVINPNEENVDKLYDHFDETKAKTIASITHELGHFRGIWDLYVVNFNGKNNPINGKGFRAPDGIMNDNTYGTLEECYWNEYELLCLNANLSKKEYRLWDSCMWEYFTDLIEVSVTEDNKPVDGFKLNFYKYESGKINPVVHIAMDNEGSIIRKEARDLFWHGSAKWQYYSMFLLEAVNANTGHKGYAFLPYYEPHMQGLKDKCETPINGKSIYKMTIDCKK